MDWKKHKLPLILMLVIIGYSCASMGTPDGTSSVNSFSVILSSGLKDVRQYASRKGIEVQPTFGSSIVAFLEEGLEGCINARSLYLRTVDFPLYPRLGSTHATTIAKVLGTLP